MPMAKRTFRIAAIWDEDAGVFFSESDIQGLHIEAPTIEEFESVMMDTALDLIIANHMTAADFAEKPVKELLPAIIWERPSAPAAA